MLSISCVIYGPFSEGERSQCQIIPGCSDAIALGVSLLLACSRCSVGLMEPCGSSTLPSGASQSRENGIGIGRFSSSRIWCLRIVALAALSAWIYASSNGWRKIPKHKPGSDDLSGA
jgi:hypothetical protein